MRPIVSLGAILLAAALSLAQQKPSSAQKTASEGRSVQTEFLAAGPFLFKPGAIQPTYMDAFDSRPVVKSPNGNLAVTVTGPKKSFEAWVTVDPSEFPDGPVQVWPIQRDVDVLWRPDGEAFALTDNRYANRSYVLVCGTNFRMGENGPGLGVPITDMTPIVEKAFEQRATKHYKGSDYETRLFYAKALRWVRNDQLLVGVSAMTVGPPTFANEGKDEWNVAYQVDLQHKSVLAQLDKEQLLSQYGIAVYSK